MDLADGQTFQIKGSSSTPYVAKNTGGVYSCTCPAWRNQSTPIEQRTCKHLKKLRGEAAELARVGGTPPPSPIAASEPKAPPILLAHSWTPDVDPAGWWMSEKVDGVRAYWDGARFISRLGNEYRAPRWFTRGFPTTPLDGELWAGRKRFQRAVSIARRQDADDEWSELAFEVFDAPSLRGTFEDRIAFVERLAALPTTPRHLHAHPHDRCRGIEHLRTVLERVESLGGEGLMLRQPGSRYEPGRSRTLLKVKTFHDDEACVVEHVAGRGKHLGRLGALLVELWSGTRFAVGSGFSDAQREAPPVIGSVITFRYQELTDGGVPRFPTFVGVRHDVAWNGGAR